MKLIYTNTVKTAAAICLSFAMMPAMSLAQNRPQAAGGGEGGGALQVMQQAFKELDLTGEQKSSLKSIITQARQDARDAITGLQDATPQERQQKRQETQKIMTDARDKAEALLTPEQKAKYFPLLAKLMVAQATERTKTIQTASGKLELTDDVKGQLKTLIDGDLKTLDGYKTDAETVKDDQGDKDLEQKLTQLQRDTRKQLVEILGSDDLKQLMQNMRPAAGGRARQGNAPTTMPGEK